MIITYRARMPLVAIALGLVATPLLAQTSAPRTTAATTADADVRLRKVEAEVRALQRKVFPESAGKTFVPEITAGQTTAAVTGTPASSAISDVLARMEALEAQLTRLTAQVEDGQNRSAKIEERLARLEADAAPATPAAVEPSTPAAAVATPAVPTPRPTSSLPAPKPAATTATLTPATPSTARVAAVQAIEKPATGDAGQDAYMYGFRLWEAKFYPEAQQALQIFVDRYPKHKMISHGRNLLGRAWLDDAKPGTAAQFFLQNYLADKAGARAPDSLLYLGVAMARLKDNEKACGAFSELAANYPQEVTGRIKTQYDNARASVKCK